MGITAYTKQPQQMTSYSSYYIIASPNNSVVKNPPAMQETPVQFPGWEDLLEKGQTTHSSILGLPW